MASSDVGSEDIDFLLSNFEQIRSYGAVLHDERDADCYQQQLPQAAAGERPRKRNRRTQGPQGEAAEPCVHCGGLSAVADAASGESVCETCGACLEALYPDHQPLAVSELHSNYLRKYHVSERLKQHCLEDSPVPEDVLSAIGRRMAGKEWSKDNLRQVLRALKQQKYIERWIQITWRLTGERPPPMSAEEIDRVQEMFALVEGPFSAFKPSDRKNMLNYNYVFRQIFILLDIPQHLPYFPLLKSRQKLSELDSIWLRICEHNDWPFVPSL